MRRFLFYAGAGAVGTAVHYTTLLCLTGFSPQPRSVTWVVSATTLGAVLGAGANYLLNYHYVFADIRRRRTLPRFAAVTVVGLVLNAAVVAQLSIFTIPLLAAQFTATAAVLASGFLLNRYWRGRNFTVLDGAFPRRRRPDGPASSPREPGARDR